MKYWILPRAISGLNMVIAEIPTLWRVAVTLSAFRFWWTPDEVGHQSFLSEEKSAARFGLCAALWLLSSGAIAAELRGTIVDADSGRPIAARVYIRDPQGAWSFCETTSAEGSALPYQEQWVPMPNSVEHTRPFQLIPFVPR